MSGNNNVLNFPNVKRERERQKKIEDIISRVAIPVTEKTYITIVGEHMEMRTNEHIPIGQYPVHKFDAFFMNSVAVLAAKIEILEEALKGHNVNVAELLTDAAMESVIRKHYMRPDE